MQETWIPSLGGEDPLGKGMAAHFSVLVWETPWSLVGYSPWGCKEWDMTEIVTLYSTGSYIHNVTGSTDFPGSSDSKAPTCNAGDLGSIPGSGRSPGEGNGNPL